MNSSYTPPEFKKAHFHCPKCNVHSRQEWLVAKYERNYGTHNFLVEASACDNCKEKSYWFNKQLIIPEISSAPQPHFDMPKSIKDDFLEARLISDKSPRAAAALLRLCVHNLINLVAADNSHKGVSDSIEILIEKGMHSKIKDALTSVRIIGEESVNPGQFHHSDDSKTVTLLFELINFIVHDRITREKELNSFFTN